MTSNSSDEEVLFAVEDQVATITLNRPAQGNSLTPAMLVRLETLWDRVKADDDIRLAVITGAGDRHFCTGAAVDSLRDEGDDRYLRNAPYREANRFSPRQCDVWKPVICLVNGLAVGGGLHFVVDSDIVIACDAAAFMDTHCNVGAVGALENIGLARRMTLGGALLLTLAGKAYRMPAVRAHQLGLVDLLAPTLPEARDLVAELAQAIKANSPQAMALSKRAIWASEEMGYHNALDLGWELLKSHWVHPDFKEGPEAFLERRSPNWNPDPDAKD